MTDTPEELAHIPPEAALENLLAFSGDDSAAPETVDQALVLNRGSLIGANAEVFGVITVSGTDVELEAPIAVVIEEIGAEKRGFGRNATAHPLIMFKHQGVHSRALLQQDGPNEIKIVQDPDDQ